jgi:K+-sensing histidine kinase KdpD
MILRGIKRARSWHLVVRIGITTAAVAAVTALQLPVDVDVPGEPFLLYVIVVVLSTGVFGLTPGFVAVAESTFASIFYFNPMYSLRLTHAVDLLAIEIYALIAVASAVVFSRLIDTALAERSAANSAQILLRELKHRVTNDLAVLAAMLRGSAPKLTDGSIKGHS